MAKLRIAEWQVYQILCIHIHERHTIQTHVKEVSTLMLNEHLALEKVFICQFQMTAVVIDV